MLLAEMDRQTYLKRLGDTVEPGGKAPAPPPVRIVQQFVNTYNHELGRDWDRLSTVVRARSWLVRRGLITPGARLKKEDVAGLREFREVLRALVTSDASSLDSNLVRSLDAFGRRAALRVVFDEHGGARLEPAASGGDRITGHILAIVYRSIADGSWQRLKACRQCGWLFFDRSKNRSADWCSMSVCGNRVKNRAYRRSVAAKQRGASSG
jgi:predicted RNA-binding Zn ribbon-like protein